MKSHFAHIATWVFDLDNTLYPPKYRLFDQIEVQMTHWVMAALNIGRAQADRLRQHYWDSYGTTLSGLMIEHNIDPAPYMHAVHDIDFTVLPPDPTLAAHLRALPGRKIVYTNGSAPYAAQVLSARGLTGIFDAVYGIEHAQYRPKPNREAFETVFGIDGFNPKTAAMFEDDPRNLLVPHQMGMTCVHIAPKPLRALHLHHHHADLTTFLGQITA